MLHSFLSQQRSSVNLYFIAHAGTFQMPNKLRRKQTMGPDLDVSSLVHLKSLALEGRTISDVDHRQRSFSGCNIEAEASHASHVALSPHRTNERPMIVFSYLYACGSVAPKPKLVKILIRLYERGS